MNYTITITKSEIKSLCESFSALSKTVLNAILPQINEEYAKVLSMADISFDSFMDKLNTSGGMSNDDFTMQYYARKDDVSVIVKMDTKFLLKLLSFYKKFLADILPYIVAFCKKHEDELDDLSELISSRAEAMTEALEEMVEEFDLDALQASAWGCFKDMMNPTGTSADISLEDINKIKNRDERIAATINYIVTTEIKMIDAASDKEAEMHRFGDFVAEELRDADADDALWITKQLFGRIIEHYEKQEKLSKEEELERKYHGKNTEE